MANFKIVISDQKTGKSYQQELKDESADKLLGLKINDTVKGDDIDLPGYEFEITGGSDNCGFPMRSDVSGTSRKRILSVGGVVGIKNDDKGKRIRKTVCGNTIHNNSVQINLKITKYGKKTLDAENKETSPEENKEDKPAEKTDNPPKEKSKEKKDDEKPVKGKKTAESPKEEKESSPKEKKE